MNKKVNTVLFLLGATVFNLLIMFLLIVLFLVLISAVFRDSLNPNVLSILMIVVFIGSIAASFFIYGRVVKWLSRKIDMEKYFLPLFRRKK
ncbi:MAG: hypothetical protein JSV89_22050 [Spirochaetaceae bacterium]|jgi:hypothetical protein|nr:MAG: hypothetical protein JSV89_22050 [Spirochaetaceae bacterium]